MAMLARRIACVCALVAFALALVIGLQTGNSFATTVLRALGALAGTFVLGWIIGLMMERVVDENLAAQEEKLKELPAESTANDR